MLDLFLPPQLFAGYTAFPFHHPKIWPRISEFQGRGLRREKDIS